MTYAAQGVSAHSKHGPSGVRWVIVPAAGRGRRMGSPLPKQYLPLAGCSVMQITLQRLYSAWPAAQLLLCLSAADNDFHADMVPKGAAWERVIGGRERADSVWNGLQALKSVADDNDLVAVHDVARPCVWPDDLMRLTAALADDPVGGLLAAPASDTMKRAVAGSARVERTESRVDLWHALTPQVFRYRVLYDALNLAYYRAKEAGVGIAETITDEASAIEAFGYSPMLIAGRRDNVKITHSEDLALAEQILIAQQLQW